MCVGVTLWFGCGDVVSGCGLMVSLYSNVKMMHGPINIRYAKINVTVSTWLLEERVYQNVGLRKLSGIS